MNGRVYNFAAGPGVMPEPTLIAAREELLDWHGSGMSVMEMSHRSARFEQILSEAKERLKHLLNIPETHEILFMQGGATAQFAALPLNFMRGGCADYAVSGHFSAVAAREAGKYGSVHIAADSAPNGYRAVPDRSELSLTAGASYFHYCANNTVYGTAWDFVPETGGIPLACDMSSEMLSHPIDVRRYALIYAGAQKNMAPAGLTVVIIDKKFAGNEDARTPSVLSYSNMIKKNSMPNTPPCWSIYILGLTLGWMERQGGLSGMDQMRHERSSMIYEVLDNSGIYRAHALPGSRSCMNITFSTGDGNLDEEFISGAAARGLVNLRGHRLTGGIRASLYNAMPVEGARALAQYMKGFEVRHHV